MEVKVRKFVNYTAQAKFLECWISTLYPQDVECSYKTEPTKSEIIEMLKKDGVLINAKDAGLEGTTEYVLHLKIELDSGIIEGAKNENNLKFHYNTGKMNIFKLTNDKGETIHETDSGKVEAMIGPSFMNEYNQYCVIELKDKAIAGYNDTMMSDALAAWIDNTGK